MQRRSLPAVRAYVRLDRTHSFTVQGEVKVVQMCTVPLRTEMTVRRTGCVSTTVTGQRLLHIATLAEGDYFGDVAILNEVPHTSSVLTSRKSEVLAHCSALCLSPSPWTYLVDLLILPCCGL